MCALQTFELANNSEIENLIKSNKLNFLKQSKIMLSKMKLMIKNLSDNQLFINYDINKLKNEQNEIINSMNEIFKNIKLIDYNNIFEINDYNNKIELINIKYKSFIKLLNSISNYQNENLKTYQTSKFCIADWFNVLVHADFNEQYYYNIEFIKNNIDFIYYNINLFNDIDKLKIMLFIIKNYCSTTLKEWFYYLNMFILLINEYDEIKLNNCEFNEIEKYNLFISLYLNYYEFIEKLKHIQLKFNDMKIYTIYANIMETIEFNDLMNLTKKQYINNKMIVINEFKFKYNLFKNNVSLLSDKYEFIINNNNYNLLYSILIFYDNNKFNDVDENIKNNLIELFKLKLNDFQQNEINEINNFNELINYCLTIYGKNKFMKLLIKYNNELLNLNNEIENYNKINNCYNDEFDKIEFYHAYTTCPEDIRNEINENINLISDFQFEFN